MKSMTGFGRAEFSNDEFALTFEISSVNRKSLDIRFMPPREAVYLDALVRKETPKKLHRGNVNIRLNLTAAGNGKSLVKVNREMLESYRNELKILGEEKPDLVRLLALPGVVEESEANFEQKSLEQSTLKTLVKALDELNASRLREGLDMKADLIERIQLLIDGRDAIEKSSEGAVSLYREKLLKRLAEANLELNLEDERLLKEIALFADRCDISEELVRLKTHLPYFIELFEKKGPVGRELDFLCQETNREFNTIASKVADRESQKIVVSMKTELERIREQVQNIE